MKRNRKIPAGFTKYTISEPWNPETPKPTTIILSNANNGEAVKLHARTRFISLNAPKGARTEITGEDGFHAVVEAR